MKHSRQSRGVVLLVVLFFALLLSSSIATFLSRSSVDAIIARNRENARRRFAVDLGQRRQLSKEADRQIFLDLHHHPVNQVLVVEQPLRSFRGVRFGFDEYATGLPQPGGD